MKFLIGLGIVQTVAILALIVLIVGDREVQMQSQHVDRVPAREVHADTSASSSFDEQRLRSIVREELAAERHSVGPSGNNQNPAKSEPEIQTAEQRIRRDRVVQTLESYKSLGTINDQQMQDLQDEIGQLDEQSRNQTMRSLMRALNTGALKGRLQ
jgi:hypothetical protein